MQEKTAGRARTLKLTTLGMLAAVAIVLVALIHFPILPMASFLEYDPADVPILIGTFLFGPWAGLGLTIVVSVLQGVTVSAQSGWIGIVMHILATGAFSLTAGFIYQKKHTRAGAALALVAGSVVMATVMVGCNLVFTPIFMGTGVGEVVAMLVPVIIPFNLLKAGINSIATFIIYKPLSKFLKRA